MMQICFFQKLGQNFRFLVTPFQRSFTITRALLRTYYDILGISPKASEKDIKNAYIKLTKECHPDLHPNDPSCHSRFVQLQEAYSTLSSPTKRKEYDSSIFGQPRSHSSTNWQYPYQSYGPRTGTGYSSNPNRDWNREQYRRMWQTYEQELKKRHTNRKFRQEEDNNRQYEFRFPINIEKLFFGLVLFMFFVSFFSHASMRKTNFEEYMERQERLRRQLMEREGASSWTSMHPFIDNDRPYRVPNPHTPPSPIREENPNTSQSSFSRENPHMPPYMGDASPYREEKRMEREE